MLLQISPRLGFGGEDETMTNQVEVIELSVDGPLCRWKMWQVRGLSFVEVETESVMLLQFERRWDCMGFYRQKVASTWNHTPKNRNR